MATVRVSKADATAVVVVVGIIAGLALLLVGGWAVVEGLDALPAVVKRVVPIVLFVLTVVAIPVVVIRTIRRRRAQREMDDSD